MATKSLSSASNIELELLMAKEEKLLKNFNALLNKLEEICQANMDLTLEQVLEYHEYSLDRMIALRKEIEARQQPLAT